MPRSHNNSPRPMTSSCFTSSCCSVTITKCIWNGSAPRALLTRRFGQNLGFREPRRRVIAGCNRRPCRYFACEIFRFGGMAEWLKAHAWKACIRETVSWVRIPLPPPVKLKLRINFQSLALYPQRKTHTALSPLPPPWSIEDIGAAFVVKDARAAKSSAITRKCVLARRYDARRRNRAR
jgi:hypothetical protein